ncbi:MAG: hypothetical protein CMJ05_09300 [Pelagibacterales bacterium]|nr:hypothetical protein [Pelagibacterales bacterium]
MEIEVKVPENLSEITLGQYQKYLKIQDGDNDEMMIAQKMIEIFCNVELKYVTKMRWKDVQEITLTLSNMFDEDSKFIKMFTLDQVQYGFIPNLDEITFGEFVDLDTYLGDWQQMDKAMSVLFRPVDINVRGRYNIKEYDGTMNEHLKEMPLSIALGAVFFLLNLGKELSQVMMDYLDKGVLKDHLQVKEGLMQNGIGITAFTQQVKEVLKNLNISPNKKHIKF